MAAGAEGTEDLLERAAAFVAQLETKLLDQARALVKPTPPPPPEMRRWAALITSGLAANPHVEYLLRLADDRLILGQRLSEWCGHAPILEEDIEYRLPLGVAGRLAGPPDGHAETCRDRLGHSRGWFGSDGETEALGPGEGVVEVRVPAALGSQEFLKVGTRNAMVIAVANVALVVDWAGRSVRCALGSVGPVVIRARDAEELISSRIDWAGRALTDDGDLAEFTALVRSAARPIDDHRSTADYRRHAVGVCAYRALGRVFANHNGETLERTSWAN